MSIDSWVAILSSDDVGGDRPTAAEVDGVRLAVYRRNDGGVVTVNDDCVHQGGAISRGWVNRETDCIVCPLHQWEFDASGRCTRIPANTSGIPIPADNRVRSYLTIERDGQILVDLDSDLQPAPTTSTDQNQDA